jgi:hypothetical protein
MACLKKPIYTLVHTLTKMLNDLTWPQNELANLLVTALLLILPFARIFSANAQD